MRGSPFLRTLLLASGLLLAGLVLWRLMRVESVEMPRHKPVKVVIPAASAERWGFELKLSAPAELVEFTDGKGKLLLHTPSSDGSMLGELTLNTADPVIFVHIYWAEATEGHRFAKLTLEPPGKPTRVRYFEAAGDLEDVWELSAK